MVIEMPQIKGSLSITIDGKKYAWDEFAEYNKLNSGSEKTNELEGKCDQCGYEVTKEEWWKIDGFFEVDKAVGSELLCPKCAKKYLKNPCLVQSVLFRPSTIDLYPFESWEKFVEDHPLDDNWNLYMQDRETVMKASKTGHWIVLWHMVNIDPSTCPFVQFEDVVDELESKCSW